MSEDLSKPEAQKAPAELIDRDKDSSTEILHTAVEQQTKDLAEYNRAFLELKNNENNLFIKELIEMDDQSPDSIRRMRQGGVTAEENETDPNMKHVKLASAFLDMEKHKDQLSYSVNFKGNKTAENYVGAADVLPANVETIMVVNSKGDVVSDRAVRGINKSRRIGYYDAKTGEYVPVHTGYRIVVLESRTNIAAEPVMARRIMMENITLFNDKENINIDREDKHKGINQLTTQPETNEQSEHAQEYQSETTEVQREVLDNKKLRAKGYKPLEKAHPKLTREAVRCLKKGGPIGTTHYMTINGKKYAFHREWHKHPPSDRRPDGSMLPPALYRKHHGISVYEAV